MVTVASHARLAMVLHATKVRTISRENVNFVSLVNIPQLRNTTLSVVGSFGSITVSVFPVLPVTLQIRQAKPFALPAVSVRYSVRAGRRNAPRVLQGSTLTRKVSYIVSCVRPAHTVKPLAANTAKNVREAQPQKTLAAYLFRLASVRSVSMLNA